MPYGPFAHACGSQTPYRGIRYQNQCHLRFLADASVSEIRPVPGPWRHQGLSRRLLPVVYQNLIAGLGQFGTILLQAGQNSQVVLIHHRTTMPLNIVSAGLLLLRRAATLLLRLIGDGPGGNRQATAGLLPGESYASCSFVLKAENSNPNGGTWHHRADYSGCGCGEPRRRKQQQRCQMRPNLRRSPRELHPLEGCPDGSNNQLVSNGIFWRVFSRDDQRWARATRYPKSCGFRERKTRPTGFGSRIFRKLMQIGRGRIAELAAPFDLHLNQTRSGDTKASVQREMIAHLNVTFEGEIQDETIWFRLLWRGSLGCGCRCGADVVGIGRTGRAASVCRFRRRLVRQRNGFALRRHDRAHPLPRGLQGQWHRTGPEADPALRQRQLQIRPQQRCHEPGRSDLRQLERGKPQCFRQSAGNRRWRQDRCARRSSRIYRQSDVANQRQQADRSDQLQGRHQRRYRSRW